MSSRRQDNPNLPIGLDALPDGWVYKPLLSLVDAERRISYGIVQPGITDSSGVPIVRVNNIKQGVISVDDILRISPEVESKYSRTRLEGGEVLLTLVGTLGECAIVPAELKGWNVARAVAVIPVLPDVSARWIAICLRSRVIQHYMNTWATTTVQATLNLRDVANLPIPLPPQNERDEIAHILGTLDDKIELNRRMNETLEAMARALFKSWFVDFDPVRAKAEKRQPAGMDAETAALFPSSFEDSTLGLIPKGWWAGKVSDVCRTQYGFTASATDEDTGARFLRVTDMNKEPWLDWSKIPFCSVEESVLPRYKLYVGDVLVSRMADPGKAAIVEENINAVFASYLVRLKTENLSSAYYLFYFLRSGQYLEYAAGATGGSVQANMNAKVIVAADMLIPHASIIQLFTQKILPLRQQIVINLQQSRTLAALRDALLPKLLSGEIRVREAEREVEQVA